MKVFLVRWGKLLYAVLFAAYFIYCARTPYAWHIIDGANLLIHEAGHILFLPFGEFVSVLGGSILQLAVPAVFAISFFWNLQFVDMCVMLLWLGESLVNVSIYAGDAVAHRLPLLSNDPAGHDWTYIFSHLNLLGQTDAISNMMNIAGIALLAIGAFGALYFSIFNRDAPTKVE
jgi:hypothetical protein